jgi:hypothetical protein
LPPSTTGSLTPTLSLSKSTVTLAATADDTATVQAIVTAQSGNGGALGGVGLGTIVEDSGSGWLSASVQGSFPALITIVCDPTGLTAATYTGTVPITDQRASNSPQNISVMFTVSAGIPAPTIVRSPTTVALSVQQGNAATATANVVITSGTAGVLAGPTVGTITGTGSTGVTAAITGTGPSYTMTVTAASAALTSAGSPYAATVPIVDADASNSPQNVTVNLTVTAVSPPATPTILLSASDVSLTAVAGSGVTRTTTVTVSSGNGATLGTTSVGTVTGTASTAVTTSVSGHVVTINAAVGSFAAGSYSATIPILNSTASNSPQNVTLTFTVTASTAPTTSVPSTILLFGSTPGNVLVVGSYPLRPGDLTAADVAANKFAIFVNGVEQSCYVQALPGIHADGTSLRAVGYQFYYNIPNATPITAEVRLGTARATTDLAKIPLTPAMSIVAQPSQTWGVDFEPTAKLVPTDLLYLCATDLTFEPLQPATADDPTSYARLVTFLGQRLTALKALTDTTRTASNARIYQATYESGRALIASWCRTGNTDHLREALRQGFRQVEYDAASLAATRPSPTNNVYGEARMVSTDGQIAEQYSLRFMSYAACWHLTWYLPFFAGVNTAHMNYNYSGRSTAAGANAINNTSTGGYIHSVWLPRFNLRQSWPHLIAYAIGANRRQSTASGFGNRDMNFVNELPLILGAYINSAYTLGDYRDGTTGLSQTSTDMLNKGGIGAGAFPNFQINYVNAFYMFYEREVYADSRIPALIKANTDVMLANAEPLTAASRGFGYTDSGYGVGYIAQPTAGAGTPDADYLGYMSGSIAYCAARYPNTVVNGATYETWYQRAVDFKNVGATSGTLGSDWSQYARGWKIFGEAFGFQTAGPYHVANGVPAGASAITARTVLTSWPV